VILGIAAPALLAPVPASAKDGVKATLTTRISLDAAPGTRLNVAWKLFSISETGQREPFGANGVFVRLLSRSGAPAEEGLAPTGRYTTGQYSASVVVPEGGIRDVVIGLQSWTSGPTSSGPGDLLFPITNDPLPGSRRAHSPARGGVHRDDGRSPAWAVTAALVALSVAGVAATRARRNRASHA
jgi:hypothetical protein